LEAALLTVNAVKARLTARGDSELGSCAGLLKAGLLKDCCAGDRRRDTQYERTCLFKPMWIDANRAGSAFDCL